MQEEYCVKICPDVDAQIPWQSLFFLHHLSHNEFVQRGQIVSRFLWQWEENTFNNVHDIIAWLEALVSYVLFEHVAEKIESMTC